MARIAFILLTHKDPLGVIEQARRLTASGDYVAIHYDRSAPAEDYRRIQTALAGNPSVVFAPHRHKCGWGEWSLVAATLETIRMAEVSFPLAGYFYMLSGDCMPIKSAEYTRAFLESDDCDYIESVDFFDGDWIKTGIKEERLIYRHWFNERTQKTLFYRSLNWQMRLGLKRQIPKGIRVMIGSQWWCLRRQTIEAVLRLIAERPDLISFFRRTWIPDETFFQTLVSHVVPKTQIRRRSPTCLMFTDYGMPVTFYNDHYDLLLRQNYLFARKISAEALELRQRLGEVWLAKGMTFAISNEGLRLHRFLTGRGRVGRRFAPRVWEAEGRLSRDAIVCLIASKKWHIAKRLASAIRDLTTVPALDYVFNELDANLPDLGGIASSLPKRERHRRALVRLLFDEYDTQKLVLCVDTSALSLIDDFIADRAQTRILLVDADFSDDYLRGHMRRIGLADDGVPPEVVQGLLPAVRGDLTQEVERLRDMAAGQLHMISERADDAANAAALARFLDIPDQIAHDLAVTPFLFSD